MDPFKAPSPYGFQALFYQRHWDMVGEQLIHLVLNVLDGQNMPENFNHTFLPLIPKVLNPQSVTQLRPIGLCNVAYKVASKVLVNRIKPVLNKLVPHVSASDPSCKCCPFTEEDADHILRKCVHAQQI